MKSTLAGVWRAIVWALVWLVALAPAAAAADGEAPEDPKRGFPVVTIPVTLDDEFAMVLVASTSPIERIVAGEALEIEAQLAGTAIDTVVCVVLDQVGCIGSLAVDEASGTVLGAVQIPIELAPGTFRVWLDSDNLGTVPLGETTVTSPALAPTPVSESESLTESMFGAQPTQRAAGASTVSLPSAGDDGSRALFMATAVLLILAVLTLLGHSIITATTFGGLHSGLVNVAFATAGPARDRSAEVADTAIDGTGHPQRRAPTRPAEEDLGPVDPALVRSSVGVSLLVRLAIIVATIVAATTAGTYLFSLTLSPIHVAEVELDVAVGGLTNTAQIDRRLASIEALSTSGAVLDTISEAYGIPPLRVDFSATTVGNSSLVRMRASNRDAATALGIVSLGTELVIEHATQPVVSSERSTVEAEIATTERALEDVSVRLAEIDAEDARLAAAGAVPLPTVEKQLLITESEVLTGRLVALEARLLDLRLDEDRRAVVITTLSEPRILDEERPLPGLQAIAIGVFVGLLLASVVAVVLWQSRKEDLAPAGADPLPAPQPSDVGDS